MRASKILIQRLPLLQAGQPKILTLHTRLAAKHRVSSIADNCERVTSGRIIIAGAETLLLFPACHNEPSNLEVLRTRMPVY